MVAVAAAALLAMAATASGQDSPAGPFGFIRMLHAVSAGSGSLEFLIDGNAVRPDGYQLGNVTGGIALKPGAHAVKFRRQGVKEGSTQVRVAANETTIVIAYAEEIPAAGTQPAQWEIHVLRLKQHQSEHGRSASFVSVSRHPELTLEIRQAPRKQWQPVTVQRLAIARTEILQARGYLPVRCQGQSLAALSVAASGNFVSVLYDDSNGNLRSVVFQDYKYLSPD